jgi:hypothetical protein
MGIREYSLRVGWAISAAPRQTMPPFGCKEQTTSHRGLGPGTAYTLVSDYFRSAEVERHSR